MSRYPEKLQKVYYFGTCLVDMMYPEAGMAGIKLLQQAKALRSYSRPVKPAAVNRPTTPDFRMRPEPWPENK